jgi:hypothetical protein
LGRFRRGIQPNAQFLPVQVGLSPDSGLQ